MAERTWSYCPVCEQWYATAEMIFVKKGFVVRGYRSFYICNSCAKRALKKKRKESV